MAHANAPPDDRSAIRLRGVGLLADGFDSARGLGAQARTLAEALAGLGVPITFVTSRTAGVEAPAIEVRGLITVYRLPETPTGEETTLGLLELFALGVFTARLGRLNLLYGVGPCAPLTARLGQALGLPSAVKIETGSRVPGATRVVTIREGVDLKRFRVRSAPKTPRIVFLGALDFSVRLDVLLEALARVRTARPEATLRIVGEGKQRAELERQAKALGLSEQVAFSDAQDSLSEMRKATVLALPDPRTCLEGLASGVPAVAFADSRAATLGPDGVLLAPARDPQGLADALLDALERGDELSALARERATAFDIQGVAEEHLAVFQDLGVVRDEDPTVRASMALSEVRDVVGAAARAGARTSASAARGLAWRAWRRLRG